MIYLLATLVSSALATYTTTINLDSVQNTVEVSFDDSIQNNIGTLIYFGVCGRAESSRMLLNHAKVPFED